MDSSSDTPIHDVLKDQYWLIRVSKLGKKKIKASNDAVLFLDELDIVDVVGERFHANNWFKYMSDKLKEQRSNSKKIKMI